MGPADIVCNDGSFSACSYPRSKVRILVGFGEKILTKVSRGVGMEYNRAIRREDSKLVATGQHGIE